ncbi:MAG: RelA/SpoT domain-containing protein [Burkholderiales bacterium]|nr:RelA/SpoT domain-containing protein [Burkholderiales bacterium]
MNLSKAQVDRLGDRLKQDPIQAEDLRLLEAFRNSFSPSFEAVRTSIERTLRAPVSGRGAKSIVAIVAKLRRERTRLSRMQDIAGCRILVKTPADQNQMADRLAALFGGCRIIDRRTSPSFGYRAVHAIVTLNDRPVEVQVRTELQHHWAQLSERLADVFGSELKYGGGPAEVKQLLLECSALVADLESREPAMPMNALRWAFDQAIEQAAYEKEVAAVKAYFAKLVRIAQDESDAEPK